MKKGKWIVVGVVACAAVLAIVLATRDKDDQTLASELVGKWQAVDLANSALHKQKEPLQVEMIEIQGDGNLLYTVAKHDAPTTLKTERWGWRVHKGRLAIQFRGEDAADDWMPSMRFNVSASTLSIMRRSFPPKEFTRVSS